MTQFVYEAPEFEEIEDGAWRIPDSNISIVELITFDNLCNKWAAFLDRENLPAEWDAQEAILHDDLTAAQRQFVTEFITDWEGLDT